MPTETELKLTLDRDAQRHVARMPLVRNHAKGRASRRRLLSVYYDTPEWSLVKQGVVFRIRRVAGQWYQTVKTAGSSTGGLHSRPEYECRLRGAKPDFDRLVLDSGLTVFADPDLQQRLVPVFETEFWRTAWDLEFPSGTLVELALDAGEVRSGQRCMPISEMELELKRGPTERLYELASEVARVVDVRLENVSKAERGYGLCTPRPVKPARATKVALERHMHIEDALAEILASCLAQIQANEEAVMVGEDIEGVHQMRIGLRRFRSALHVFGTLLPSRVRRPLGKELQVLTRPLGPCRDWDVFALEQIEPILAGLPADHPCQALGAAVALQRRRCRAALLACIHSRPYNQLILKMTAWTACRQWREGLEPDELDAMQQPLHKVLPKLLARGHRQVVAQGKEWSPDRVAAMHRLRILIKRQRYAAEFFQSLYPRKMARGYIKAFRTLQEVLGQLNDAATAMRLLDQMPGETITPSLIAFVEGWYARGRHDAVETFPAAWQTFRAQKRFWK